MSQASYHRAIEYRRGVHPSHAFGPIGHARSIDRRSCAVDAENISVVTSDLTDSGYDLIIDGERHVLFDDADYDPVDALERTVDLDERLAGESGGERARSRHRTLS